MELINKKRNELLREIESLNRQLEEANDTIEAIRKGDIDALVVHGENGHQLYTLQSADQTYRIFIEKMTEGAVTLNQQGIIEYCNLSFASMINLPISNILGAAFIEFLEPESRQKYLGLFEQCWRNDCKDEVLLKGKTVIPVQLSLTSMDIQDRKSLSILVTDLSTHKRTQQQLNTYNKKLEETNHALEDSNHDLQQFASVASHDLQEPVRKIQIFSQRLKDKYQQSLSEEAENYLNKIIFSAGRMKSLIIDILNYSKLSAETIEYEVVDLNELMQDVLSDFDLIIQEKKATISKDHLMPVEANKQQIRQVFQNIISNSMKFVHPDQSPVIHISCSRINHLNAENINKTAGPYCLISIRDNGIGFDQKFAPNVFSLFERLNAKDKFEGTGIGLSIAKKIIEKHHGEIEVQSKIGKGTIFNIFLPERQTRD